MVAREHRALHQKLVALRNQAFAHSDHETRGPFLGYIDMGADRQPFISFGVPKYAELEKLQKEIRSLLVQVEGAVATWLTQYRFSRTKPRVATDDL